jgi:peptide/nickel transport system permease protein
VETKIAPDRSKTDEAKERVYVASQYRLMWWKLRKHKLAMAGGAVLLLMYLAAVFCEFLSPYEPLQRDSDFIYAPPQRVRILDQGRLRLPFVYGLKLTRHPVTWKNIFVPDTSKVYPVRLFVRGSAYKMWGLFDGDLHLLGVAEGTMYLFGSDRLGRDMFSRVLYGARVSLSIGLIGVFLSFLLGLAIGGASGYFGGMLDVMVQRVIEFLRSIPTIPLWMALAAALPPHWPATRIYFGITIILSLIGWTDLARVVRGKLLALRGEDFVLAARLSGAGDAAIIVRHLIPSFLSYVIVSVTLAVPHMILAETALSYLGLGLRPPVVSWGVLLSEAQNVTTIALSPWLMIPGLFVIVIVLAFNFAGDGLRDAADPYVR